MVTSSAIKPAPTPVSTNEHKMPSALPERRTVHGRPQRLRHGHVQLTHAGPEYDTASYLQHPVDQSVNREEGMKEQGGFELGFEEL